MNSQGSKLTTLAKLKTSQIKWLLQFPEWIMLDVYSLYLELSSHYNYPYSWSPVLQNFITEMKSQMISLILSAIVRIARLKNMTGLSNQCLFHWLNIANRQSRDLNIFPHNQ